MNKAIFLDRDGVLNHPLLKEGKSYPPKSLEHFTLMPHALEATLLLKNAGFLLIVVTNQPDVGRGLQTVEMVEQMHHYLISTLPLDAIEVCYHENDPGYKPSPGMLMKAAHQHQISLSKSYMIGDRWRDIDAGSAAGCCTILIDHHYSETLRTAPHYTCANLLEAANYILLRG